MQQKNFSKKYHYYSSLYFDEKDVLCKKKAVNVQKGENLLFFV